MASCNNKRSQGIQLPLQSLLCVLAKSGKAKANACRQPAYKGGLMSAKLHQGSLWNVFSKPSHRT